MKTNNKWDKIEIIFELLIFGIVIGIIEDIVAIKVATGQTITLRTVGIVALIAFPFAVLGEVIFDRIDFASIFKRMFGGKRFGIFGDAPVKLNTDKEGANGEPGAR